ncbi:cell cycle checkpoint protein RAD17 isoform X1 [Neodiprion fabricii]|uniref:cell cycle checkpoint protein RAD17 isoform X1 n=2 Tax=Neodiprion fabricii TaxID=2872261 RepID=UPI001ED9340A|nr:cell cycle checkpoint protein RAD17 isoform X1 [Neodiprion fabricii]
MSGSKNLQKTKGSRMSWSFDCDVSERDVVTPAKRPKIETEVPSLDRVSRTIDIYDKKTHINSLPALLKACEPQEASELSISRQKQREIYDWLEYKTIRSKPCALILSGPSGCGKTVSFKLLAKEKEFECVEWITPADQGADENNRFTRQGDKFQDFMVRTTRYGSLFEDCCRRLLLVKDFPNVYFNDKDAIHTLLEQYFGTGKEPVVFICTDSGGMGALQTLFPPNVREKFGICHISINPVTQAVTKNILKRVSLVFNTRASHMVHVSQHIVEEILSNNIGDIRSTVINLIFASLKVPNRQIDCEGRGRGESLSLLHAIGRVTNPKRLVEGNSWKFVHDPDEIAYFFQTQPSTFARFLHENHLNTTRGIEEATAATDILSISDCLISDWRDSHLGRLGLSFCIRGIMITNNDPVPGWNPVRKPRNDEKICRDLASTETLWYKSLISPKLASTITFKGLGN